MAGPGTSTARWPPSPDRCWSRWRCSTESDPRAHRRRAGCRGRALRPADRGARRGHRARQPCSPGRGTRPPARWRSSSTCPPGPASAALRGASAGAARRLGPAPLGKRLLADLERLARGGRGPPGLAARGLAGRSAPPAAPRRRPTHLQRTAPSAPVSETHPMTPSTAFAGERWVPSLLAALDHLGHAAGLDAVRRSGRPASWCRSWRRACGGGHRHAAALGPGAGAAGRGGAGGGRPAVAAAPVRRRRRAGRAAARPRPRCRRCYACLATRSTPRPDVLRAGAAVGAAVLPAADHGRRADRGGRRLARGRPPARPAGRAAAAGGLHRAGEHPRRRRVLADCSPPPRCASCS